MFNKIIQILKNIQADFMDGYNNGRIRSSMGWSYNLKQYRRKK